jgi:superfamily II DNA or RNA helicase
VLTQANQRLLEIRKTQPDAGGLVIAMDQDHARGIARMLQARTGAKATVVTSDDPTSSSRIAAFAHEDTPWIVAVRMVSEGVDIPRLRVGVFATTTTTELFFRQAVGRLVRWTKAVGKKQPAFLFIPDDARLRARAHQIADLRRHSLTKAERETVADPSALDTGEEEQMSLFSAISSVALDAVEHDAPEWMTEPIHLAAGDDDDDGFLVDLPPLPGRGMEDDIVGAPTRRKRRQQLRDLNADSARALVQRTGMSHAKINAELNRLSGVQRISDATVEQLERRLMAAERLLARV